MNRRAGAHTDARGKSEPAMKVAGARIINKFEGFFSIVYRRAEVLRQHKYVILRRKVFRSDPIHKELDEFALGPAHALTSEQRECVCLLLIQAKFLCLLPDGSFRGEFLRIAWLEFLEGGASEGFDCGY